MAVKPRPASTVILVDSKARVYMTKRPDTMRFLGGYYVFPGGAVEPDDHEVRPSSLQKENSIELSYYIAAARELFEEVGIFLGCREDGSPFNLKEEKTSAYRQNLMNGSMSFSNMLKKESLRLDLDLLRYFGHFITPEMSPIRFDTRFFIASLPAGQSPQPDRGEIADAFWVSPLAALEALKTGEMPMVKPTILSLAALGKANGKVKPMLMDGMTYVLESGLNLFPDETVS